jgi:predicted dehydrogenase
MAAKIRVGIVGATVTPGGSGWGANAHVPALNALPGYVLRAVCTAHEETAEASAEAFGAELAFHDYEAMTAHPDIDLIAVVVRVPGHHVLDELARVQQGHIGEVVSASMGVVGQAVTRRGLGRIWQGDRRNGANTLTIAGGHAIDALCFVLGEFAEVSARLATRIDEWHNTDTGETVRVDAPDWISVSGRLAHGAEVAFLVTTVPFSPSGNRFEIYGREGTLVLSGGTPNIGPSRLHAARGDGPLTALEIPERFTLVPEGIPAGPPRNVAQAYARLARAMAAGERFEPDFAHAVTRHALLAAIERSAAEGRAVSV